jgi:hypothetical protein
MDERKRPNVKTTKPIRKTRKNRTVDTDGVIQEIDESYVEEDDFGFIKIWLAHMDYIVYRIGGSKIKVLFFILMNMDKNKNTLCMTQKEMVKKTGIGYNTINAALKKLREDDYVRSKNGVYMVNPELIFRGKYNKRMYVRKNYLQFDNGNSCIKNTHRDSTRKIKKAKRVPVIRVPIIINRDGQSKKAILYMKCREWKRNNIKLYFA